MPHRHRAIPSGERVWRSVPAAVLLSAAAVCLAAAGGSIASADGPRQASCQTGRTLFSSGAVRAFKVTDRSDDQEAFVCPSPSAKPIAIDDPGPAVEIEAGNFHLRGVRLGFELDDFGLGTGAGDTRVGWVDLQSGDVAVGTVNAGRGASKSDPLLPADLISYAFAPDGTMAVIAGTNCEVVAVLPLAARPVEGVYGLGPPLVVFTARHGGLVHWSIAVTATAVRWRSVRGHATAFRS
jgi:hypothetical protein